MKSLVSYWITRDLLMFAAAVVLGLFLVYLLGCLPVTEYSYSYCVAEYDWTYDRVVKACGPPEYTTWDAGNMCAVYSNSAVCFSPTHRVFGIRNGHFGGYYFHGGRGHGGRR
jgi:hypothetical protein